MVFIFLMQLKTIYKRLQIYRRLNRLERIKLNGIRRKHRLPPIHTFWDWIWDIMCFPFNFVSEIIYDFYERVITSIGGRGSKKPRKGHMRRSFKNFTEENKLFRKIMYFLFGLIITFLLFLFLYSQHFLNNYALIGTTIAFTILFALIAPFNDSVLCLTLIGLPSMFSSKVRYILIAYIMYTLYFQVFPNIWNNSMEGIESFGCSVWQTGKGGKKLAGLLVEDIKRFVRSLQQKMRDIIKNMKDYLKAFDLNIKIPTMNVKALCNEPTDKDTYDCEDKLTMFSVSQNRVFIPGVCDLLWTGFADFCENTKEGLKGLYSEARKELVEFIEKLERELYFDVDLNHDFDYHYNSSKSFSKAFKQVGDEFMERHYLLAYIPYVLNVRTFLMLIFTLWIIVISIIYRYRYLRSDPFDNSYINEEILKIDQKRAEAGKQTVIPLDLNEKKHFIYPFDPIMTPIEYNRFVFGISLFAITLGQIFVYFALDVVIYSLAVWYNQFIEVLSDIFAPASIRINASGDSFLASKLNQLNDAFDVKKLIVKRLQECKSIPLAPDRDLYKQILYLLVVVLLTIFTSAYGLRLRHYFAGLFYPHRIPVRAVWLYNAILCRRGNIFQFFRKQMRAKVFGTTKENVSFIDRLCAQWTIIRVVFTLLGLYGKHKYCQVCGMKVLIDGTDQSVHCAHSCGAIYCFDCLGDRNNICSVCMNPIDYSNLGDISEELDSSDEDIAYELQNEDFLYQYSKQTESDERPSEQAYESDPSAYLRKDLVSLAYRYDSVDRVPTVVYLVNDEDYDGEDESEDKEDYQKNLFDLEQELGIPAEQIIEMKENAKLLVNEDMNGFPDRVREQKYWQIKKEDDQRLVRNALMMVNKDRKKYIKKSRTKLN